jgi:hypothetical protein
MRPFHYRLLGLALLVLLGLIFFLEKPTSPAPLVAEEASKSQPPRAKRPLRPSIPRAADRVVNLPTLSAPAPPPVSGDPLERQEWITSQVHEIERLAWFDDPESLAKILAELRSPVAEVREAALNATVTSGSRAAVPYLKRLSAETEDPAQRKAVDEAIDYLNLPTLVESLDQDALGQGAPTR